MEGAGASGAGAAPVRTGERLAAAPAAPPRPGGGGGPGSGSRGKVTARQSPVHVSCAGPGSRRSRFVHMPRLPPPPPSSARPRPAPPSQSRRGPQAGWPMAGAGRGDVRAAGGVPGDSPASLIEVRAAPSVGPRQRGSPPPASRAPPPPGFPFLPRTGALRPSQLPFPAHILHPCLPACLSPPPLSLRWCPGLHALQLT